MDALKDALAKRKNNLHQGFKISIELEPDGMKEEEKDKKLGLAPTVKDSESVKEKKLMPEVEIEMAEDVPGQENAPGLKNPVMEMENEEDDGGLASGMPEMPNGREPNSLHERAMMAMKQKMDMRKNSKK